MSQNSKPELAWAAGFYEGEGSVSVCGGHRLILSVGQVDREPLNRFAAIMDVGAITGPKRQTSPLSRKPFFQFQANGPGALSTAWEARLHGIREYSPRPLSATDYAPELET